MIRSGRFGVHIPVDDSRIVCRRFATPSGQEKSGPNGDRQSSRPLRQFAFQDVNGTLALAKRLAVGL